MDLRLEMNPDKEIIGEKRDDSFSSFGYSEKIKARKKDVQALHAEVKLRLFFFMWFTVNHIPVSLNVFHAAR